MRVGSRRLTPGPPKGCRFMRTRTSIVVLGAAGAALLAAACVVPANNPPPAVSYGQPPPQPGYQQPEPQPAPPPAQPVPEPYVEGPVYEDIQVADVQGDEVPIVDVFYDQLDPYGSWYDDRTYGWVFVPNQPGYTPYSNGYWKNTEYGFTWVSGDPFGWATDHYGRWVWVNRWAWVPDTTWGPAWVQWREGNGYVGWAPTGYTDEA